MNNNYYIFKEDDAFSFMRYVNCVGHKRGNELVFVYCPYCNSKKDKGTFSINLQTGQFQCKRSKCGAQGNMLTLSKDFNFSLGGDVDAHYNLRGCNDKYKKYKKVDVPKSMPAAVTYLQSRGISEATANKYGVTIHKDKPNILIFPFFDSDGNLVCIKNRKTDFDKSRDKCKEWFEKDNKPILFGIKQCNLDNKTLVITEGQIDSLSLAEAGIENAVSVPNGCKAFTWIPHCWDFVNKFDEIIVFGDCENGGITLVDEISRRFNRLKVKVVQEADYLGCKDANEILQKHGKYKLMDAVKNARLLATSSIISMADVESVDLDRLESFKTRFREIDSLFGDGIPFGSLVVLKGKRGDGKSTFASQLYAECLDQGYKCFMYSGELANTMAKKWLDSQLTGLSIIPSPTMKKLNRWYSDKSFMYDNRMIDDELPNVEKLVLEAVSKFDCRFILIDNLMTAIVSGDNSEHYHKQGEFCRRMARMSKRYNVAIVLIVHPNKTIYANTDEMDSISGSADISNAADIVMSYSRDKNLNDDSLRAVQVIKNRYNGKLLQGVNAVCAKYDNESKRIVSINDSFDKVYSWQTDKEGFTPIDDTPAELPFV